MHWTDHSPLQVPSIGLSAGKQTRFRPTRSKGARCGSTRCRRCGAACCCGARPRAARSPRASIGRTPLDADGLSSSRAGSRCASHHSEINRANGCNLPDRPIRRLFRSEAVGLSLRRLPRRATGSLPVSGRSRLRPAGARRIRRAARRRAGGKATRRDSGGGRPRWRRAARQAGLRVLWRRRASIDRSDQRARLDDVGDTTPRCARAPIATLASPN